MIRRLEERDRTAYLAMARAFYDGDAVDHPVPNEFLERTFDALMGETVFAECYVFEIDEELRGYALLAKTWSQEAGGMVVWLEELYVRPEYQGKGLGQAFFDYLKQNMHPARFRLETEPHNDRAKSLYRRMGFRPLQYDSFILGN